MDGISMRAALPCEVLFFFNDTATTEIYTLSLHDALPIYDHQDRPQPRSPETAAMAIAGDHRSEEHTSELQSRRDLVCRLLLEKKKREKNITLHYKKKKKKSKKK